MKTNDLELPIGYVPITGPGVDALESRKEVGSPICLEDAINRQLRDYLGSPLCLANKAAIRKLIRTPIRR
jgi:hypothetical protein